MAAMRKLTAVLRKPANLDSFNAKTDSAYHQAMCVTAQNDCGDQSDEPYDECSECHVPLGKGPFINSLELTDL